MQQLKARTFERMQKPLYQRNLKWKMASLSAAIEWTLSDLSKKEWTVCLIVKATVFFFNFSVTNKEFHSLRTKYVPKVVYKKVSTIQKFHEHDTKLSMTYKKVGNL